MMSVIRCHPCGKSFTGPVNYKQHVASEKHKKKVSLNCLNGSSGTDDSQVLSTTTQKSLLPLECPVCEITFDSSNSFQKHSLSLDHAQKVMENNSEKSTAFEFVGSSQNFCDRQNFSADKDVYDGEGDRILPPCEMIKSQTLTFATCNTCDKSFSGPEPYKQHIESAAHKRKIEDEKNFASGDNSIIVSQFSCDPCKKKFTGKVPYQQHMNSENHKKKSCLTSQLLEKETTIDSSLTSTIDSVSEIEESKVNRTTANNVIFCQICNVMCSGSIPYEQHINGSAHRKNIDKAKIESSNFKPEESIQLALQNRSKGQKEYSIQLNGKNNKTDTDYIFPGIDNFKTMSTEELMKCVTVFTPDTPVDFDESQNGLNTDSLNAEFHTPEVQPHEIGEASDAYETCSYCNVNLRSKEDAKNHFESLDHYAKRWQAN